MDFKDTAPEAKFRAEARNWIEANVELRKPDEDPFEHGRRFQAKKQQAGWACLTWPKEHGGRGASVIENLIFDEEMSRYPDQLDAVGLGISVVAPTLMEYMSDEQKKRYLPKIASGEEVWCQLFSEPAAGSDLAGVITKAERDGDDWIINGQKTWTSIAQHSHFGILVARSDSQAAKHKGLTYFFVDMRSPGVEVKSIKQNTGEAHFNETYFTNVRIPDSQRLGDVGAGWRVALHTLMNERTYFGNQGSIKNPDVRSLVALAQKTNYLNHSGLENGAIRDRIADLYIRESGLKHTRNRFKTSISKGEEPGPENSIGKFVRGKLAQEISSFCLDLLDGAGAAMDSDLVPGDGFMQMSYMRTPGARLAGGSDEIQLNILAERVLGLPQDIRVDKGLPFIDIPKGPA